MHAQICRVCQLEKKIQITLRLLLLTGSNFSDFAILFTFRVLILAILDFNHKTH